MTPRPILRALVLLPALATVTARAAPPAPQSARWIAAWTSTPSAADNAVPDANSASAATPIYGSRDLTLRQIVPLSIGGPQLRVVFTNQYGVEPLTIGAAFVAVSQGGSSINLVSAAGLTFAGRTAVTIPPGALAISDPAPINVPAGSDLAISFFLPAQPISRLTQHPAPDQASYATPGNAVGAKAFDRPVELHSWLFLKGVEVTAPTTNRKKHG